MKIQRLPEKEYLKLYKLTRKYLDRWTDAVGRGANLKADRLLKKMTALIGRAVTLENQMRVPKERRWTRGI